MTYHSIRQKSIILLVFVAVGFLLYSNTFDVPFHYDDAHVVSDLSFEEMLEKSKGGGSRVIAHVTFLFNYWLGGTNVLGYHILNTLIHIGTAFFVYLFLYQILSLANRLERFEQLERFNRYAAQSNPQIDTEIAPGRLIKKGHLWVEISDPAFWPAFFGGLLFLVHPMATQAVTYITQRYTSLAGFFYIGSLAMFISARAGFRQDGRFFKSSHLILYLCSLVMAGFAMRTKEMAITLPLAILLAEYYFIQSDLKASGKRLLYLLPLLSTGLIIPISDMIGVETLSLENVSSLQDYTWGQTISRKEYLLTQFKIILGVYLKLFVWPVGQNIDHDYVVSKAMLDPQTAASFLALCSMVGIGLWLFARARLISFATLWFFVTISPTSSIIPNTEFVAEHRAYISLMGLAFAAAGLPSWHTKWKRYILLLLPVLFLFSCLTYARNNVWHTDLTLWADSVAKAETRARPHNNLANALFKRGRINEAIDHYSTAIQIEPGHAMAYNNLATALAEQGAIMEAVTNYSRALQLQPGYADAHYNIGTALAKHGSFDEAISHYSSALQLRSNFPKAYNNLGNALAAQGRFNDAITHYSQALTIKPGYFEAHNNIGTALYDLGMLKQSMAHYSEALRIKPDFADAHNNLGVALMDEGDLEGAIEHYEEAVRIRPELASAHNNLGSALATLGKVKESIRHFSMALRIKPDYDKARKNLELALRLMKDSSKTSGGK